MSVVHSQSQSILREVPGANSKGGGAYGIRTLRSLRQPQAPSERLQKKIDTAYNYFLTEVDPIMGECITSLLCEQPIDVPGAMLNFFNKKVQAENATEEGGSNNDAAVAASVAPAREEEEESEESIAKAKRDKKRPRKEHKLYLAMSIGPVVTKLVNRVASTRPKKVASFICEELQTLIYGSDEDKDSRLMAEVESDERFDMYKGQNGPRVSLKPEQEREVPIPVESPEVALDSEPQEPLVPKSGAHDPLGNNPAETVQSDATVTISDTPVVAVTAPEPTVQKIQFAVVGMDGAGKSSVMNMLQGGADKTTKPTIGFRPVTLMLGEELQIRFYDIGGGPKIREIWPQYYHDVHGVIYVVDSTDADERAEEGTALFKSSLMHEFIANKPTLVLATKQDVEGAATVDDIKARLGVTDLPSGFIAGCKAVGAAEEVDPRIETALEELIGTVQGNFDTLQARLASDSAIKAKDDQKRRLARERKVLKNKIAIAFTDLLSEENKPDLGGKEPNPEDAFTEEEGLGFLTSELGEDLAALPREALEISAMVGYQRLALQIVGSLKVPISKKKDPMSWLEIYDLIVEIRVELGLMMPDFAEVNQRA